MTDAYILDGVRTPIGRYGGMLAARRPDDLAAHVLRSVVERSGIEATDIDEVVFGAANQAGEDNRNVARMAALLAGLPESIPGFTVNRLCASVLTAITTARQMIAAGDFFEHAWVHGDWKGTARQSVEPQLAAGQDVLLEIDWQGAQQVRQLVPGTVTVFILPPSKQALQDRMRKRGQDSEAVIAQRLGAARDEMLHFNEFDYVIVNEVFDTAVDELCAIFTASRLRREAQKVRHAGLIQALLTPDPGATD